MYFALKSCDFPAGAAEVCFFLVTRTRTTFVLKSCDFPAGAARCTLRTSMQEITYGTYKLLI